MTLFTPTPTLTPTPQTTALFIPQREDLPQFAELDRQCLGGLWTLAGYEREWDSECGFLLGLSQGETLVGMGAFWQVLEEAHITLLAVMPEFRRRGHGQTLLRGLLYQAQKNQLERATLEVRASNHGAIALYEKWGFRAVGRRKRYYDDGEDGVILWIQDLQGIRISPDGLPVLKREARL